MLLDFQSRYDLRKIQEVKLHSSVTTVDEGSPMVGVLENGVSVANIWSAGAASFLGFAKTRLKYPQTGLEVETLTVAAGAVTLKYAPTANTQVQVINVTTGAAMTRVASLDATATEYTLANGAKVINTLTSLNGNTLRVVYRRSLTIAEAQARWGHGVQYSPMESTEVTGTISLIRGGVIFIDNINAATNWSATTAAYVGAGGIITNADTSGILIPGFRVVSLPTADVPYLGFEFGAI